jgi:hypothetical protein
MKLWDFKQPELSVEVKVFSSLLQYIQKSSFFFLLKIDSIFSKSVTAVVTTTAIANVNFFLLNMIVIYVGALFFIRYFETKKKRGLFIQQELVKKTFTEKPKQNELDIGRRFFTHSMHCRLDEVKIPQKSLNDMLRNTILKIFTWAKNKSACPSRKSYQSLNSPNNELVRFI